MTGTPKASKVVAAGNSTTKRCRIGWRKASADDGKRGVFVLRRQISQRGDGPLQRSPR